jgi:hypothetical protein
MSHFLGAEEGKRSVAYTGGSFIGGHQKPKFHFRCRVVMFLCLGSFRELAHHYDNGWPHSYQHHSGVSSYNQ